VLRWCSVVDVLFRRGLSRLVLTSAFVCRPIWITVEAPVGGRSITVYCGYLCGSYALSPACRAACAPVPRPLRLGPAPTAGTDGEHLTTRSPATRHWPPPALTGHPRPHRRRPHRRGGTLAGPHRRLPTRPGAPTRGRARRRRSPAEHRQRKRTGGCRPDRTARGDIAAIIEPAHPSTVAPLLLAARGLAPRERDVALLVMRGASTAAIGAELHLSAYTVKDHLKSIFDKIGVRSRRDLVPNILTSQRSAPSPHASPGRPSGKS
jgi:DNA-binding CsgD family transcriptional regulator